MCAYPDDRQDPRVVEAPEGLAMTFDECVSAMRDNLGDDVLVDDGAEVWTLANLDDELRRLFGENPGETRAYSWDGTGVYRVLGDGFRGARVLRVVSL